jgi:hypothetical protein
MRNKITVAFGLLTAFLSAVPGVCSAQCGPQLIEIQHRIPNTIFAPGANPGPMFTSVTNYRLRIDEEREFWSTSNPPSLSSKRYYATLPTDLFMSLWKTSPEYARLNNSRVVSAGNNVSLEMFRKFISYGGLPLLVSFEDSLSGGRSKTLTLTIRKWATIPAPPPAPPGGFAPAPFIGPDRQPFEASNEYPLTIPFKVVDSCQK